MWHKIKDPTTATGPLDIFEGSENTHFVWNSMTEVSPPRKVVKNGECWVTRQLEKMAV